MQRNSKITYKGTCKGTHKIACKKQRSRQSAAGSAARNLIIICHRLTQTFTPSIASDIYAIHSHMVHFFDSFIIYRLDFGNRNCLKVRSLQRKLIKLFLARRNAHLLN